MLGIFGIGARPYSIIRYHTILISLKQSWCRICILTFSSKNSALPSFLPSHPPLPSPLSSSVTLSLLLSSVVPFPISSLSSLAFSAPVEYVDGFVVRSLKHTEDSVLRTHIFDPLNPSKAMASLIHQNRGTIKFGTATTQALITTASHLRQHASLTHTHHSPH